MNVAPATIGQYWIQTNSGARVSFDRPRPADIVPGDLAHHLGQLARFTGACRDFYSVAQHCVLASHHCSDPAAALLHDAAEAYCGDWNRPLKLLIGSLCPDVLAIENRLLEAVALRFDLDPAQFHAPVVREVDQRLLATERRDLMTPTDDDWGLPPPFEFRIRPWTWEEASFYFLHRLRELGLD